MPRQTGELMRLRIRQAIAELTTKNGRPPTNRELGQYLGGPHGPKSTGHIDYHLRYMREQGIISHEPRKSRGITLIEQVTDVAVPPRPVRIPLLGRIAAGSPIEAAEVADEYVDITEGLAYGGDIFALQVKGQSMIEDHIDDGDVVIVRRQSHASEGDTVVALLKNGATERWEATLKRFHREKGGKIRLQPRNSTMGPIIVSDSEVEIQGKAIGILRRI